MNNEVIETRLKIVRHLISLHSDNVSRAYALLASARSDRAKEAAQRVIDTSSFEVEKLKFLEDILEDEKERLIEESDDWSTVEE